jgi:hypothetical protein
MSEQSFNTPELREIKAINVLVCILNFYRMETATAALHQATKIMTEGGELPRVKRETVWWLRRIFLDLIPKSYEEAESTEMVTERISFRGGKAPCLVSWEKELFNQLVEEYRAAEPEEIFGVWVMKRAGISRKGIATREPGVLLVREREKGPGLKTARLVSNHRLENKRTRLSDRGSREFDARSRTIGREVSLNLN